MLESFGDLSHHNAERAIACLLEVACSISAEATQTDQRHVLDMVRGASVGMLQASLAAGITDKIRELLLGDA